MTEGEWISSEDPLRMLRWLTLSRSEGDDVGANYPLIPSPLDISDRKLSLFDRALVEQLGMNTPALQACRRLAPSTARLVAALLRDLVGNPWRPVPGDRPVGFHYACERCGNVWERKGVHSSWRTCQKCGEQDHIRKWRERDRWLTPTVLALARAAYLEQRQDGLLDPVRLAVLADALEDAGCNSADLLAHLHAPGPHACGCWALDLILREE